MGEYIEVFGSYPGNKLKIQLSQNYFGNHFHTQTQQIKPRRAHKFIRSF